MDLTDRLHTVHIRHFPVDQNDAVVLIILMALFDHLDCFSSVRRPLRMGTHFLQIRYRVLAQPLIVIYDEDIPVGKAHIFFLHL